MKKALLTIYIFSAFIFTGTAQAPAIEWQKCLGGTGAEDAYCIQQTSDGGYIVAGYSSGASNGDVTGNHGSADFWVVKLDGSGTIQWQKCLGGSDYDVARSIQQTSDGGYIVAGSSKSNNGDVTSNRGNDDCWVVKLDDSGTIQWQKTLGGSDQDVARSIQQTSDGGYILAGFSRSNDGDATGNHGNDDYWVVKLDGSGTIEWQKSLGGLGLDYATSIQQTADGGYIVAGASKSNNGDVTGNHGTYDYWVVKLDDSGTIQWQKSLGGSSADIAYSIQQTTDGGYVVAGDSKSIDGDPTGNHGNQDYWVVKLDGSGSVQWQKSLGGTDLDGAYSIQQTSDGGYIVAGVSGSNDGDPTGNHGDYDYWVVKLGSAMGMEDQGIASMAATVYPNPGNGLYTLNVDGMEGPATLTVTDVRGRVVHTATLNTTTNRSTHHLDLSHCASGIYTVTIGTHAVQHTIKVGKE